MEKSLKKPKTFVGYTPREHQVYVHNGITKNGLKSGHIHCVKAKRQIGKSWIIINELLRFAINYKGTVSGCLSPTLNQARKIYKEILKATDQSGVIRKKNDSLLEIEFINGSTILFKSGEQKESLRGYTISGILCIDEAAYISDEVWGIIRPTCDVWKAPILMVSTPRFRMGFFFDLFMLGMSGNPKITSYDLCKFDTSEFLSLEMVELYKQMMPKNLFISEILGEFLDSESVVFGDFKQCIGYEPQDYKDLFVGIDWGSGVGSDDTVLIGLNERNEQVILLYFNNKSTAQQVDYIVQYLEPYKHKIRMVVAETNGIGRPLYDSLRLQLDKKIPMQEFNTTNAEKIRIINRLQVAFEQYQIKLLDDDKQTSELSMYEATVKSNGTVTYNAPIGANDDIVMSLMFAMEAKERKNKTGKYKISFV